MSIMNILKVDCDPKKIGLNRFSVTDNFLRILALQEITNFIFYSFYSTLLKFRYFEILFIFLLHEKGKESQCI